MKGGGFLKHAIDSLKQNRNLLKKRRSLKEIYGQTKSNTESTYNSDDVIERVELYRNRQRKLFRSSAIKSVILLISVLTLAVFVFMSFFNSGHEKMTTKPKLFNSVVYDISKTEQLKIDYFKNGPKAAETRLKNGMKHQNSESYYPTGEQFRSALYFHDTLIVDYYFYKTGDTISNFPQTEEGKIHHIKLQSDSLNIRFDYIDGKIVFGTYNEQRK